MNSLLVLLVLIAIAIPSAVSIECYECSNPDGNCKENKKDCSNNSTSIIIAYDRCSKIVVGEKVTKGCVLKSLCDNLCKNINDCTASCCDSDLCNASTTKAPVFILISVTAMICFGYLV